MNERTLRKRLNWMTVVVVLISILIIAGGSFASSSLRGILQDALTRQVESNAEQYKINIKRKIEGDFQTLNTLTSFLRFGKMDTGSFINGLMASKEYTEFDSMGYFGTTGTGLLVNADTRVERELPLEEMNEYVQESVQTAWTGESAISRIYYSSDILGNTFAYAVPVYSGDQVAGALVAEVSTEVFAEVLQNGSVLNGYGYIHMISDNGTLLVRSEQRVVQEKLDTIYDHDYIVPEEQKRIKEALTQGESCMSKFTYEGVTYQIFFEPLEVNGWYLFCVQTARSVNSSVYQIMTSTRSVTVFVLLALLLLILMGYRQIYRSNHRLIKSAWYDPLTGAYNMTRFEQDASMIIEKTQEYALVAMNVRQFKFFNEIFGSRTGDQLLCCIKEVIESHVQTGEYFCRSTDDLFYILFKETDRTVIRRRLEEMIEEISQYSSGHNGSYQIMLYCGGVIGTEVKDTSPSVQTSMTHVKFALNTAKQSLKRSIWFYDIGLHEDEILENYVESHMYLAMEKEEFQMYLQPKVDLKTGRISGAEALVRWIPESGKMIYPGQFIPIFENNGFCDVLDLYMVEKVCRQLREWIDQGKEPLPLSVNQSKLLFYEADYIHNMKALLEKYQIPASLITLEILEGLAMKNVEEVNERIDRLTEMGFNVSMDDFGSGYSSLNTLASLRINELKIDREFLLRLQKPGEDHRRQIIIMNKVVELTKELKIKTVVEGVENEEDEKLVQKMGCDQGQGFYYSRPVSAEEFSEKYIVERIP